MAKTVITTIQCDVCLSVDDLNEGETVGVSLDNARAREIDLCERHHKELVEPLALALTTFGRGGAAKASASSPAASKTVAATGTFVCDQCGRSFPKAQGLNMHITRTHGRP